MVSIRKSSIVGSFVPGPFVFFVFFFFFCRFLCFAPVFPFYLLLLLACSFLLVCVSVLSAFPLLFFSASLVCSFAFPLLFLQSASVCFWPSACSCFSFAVLLFRFSASLLVRFSAFTLCSYGMAKRGGKLNICDEPESPIEGHV